jgi:hypothetical protein
LTDKKFNIVSKVDKYGRKVNKKDKTMEKFYKVADEQKPKRDESESD